MSLLFMGFGVVTIVGGFGEINVAVMAATNEEKLFFAESIINGWQMANNTRTATSGTAVTV